MESRRERSLVAGARESFNGATTSRSWNPSAGWTSRGHRAASMGPRPRGRGIRLAGAVVAVDQHGASMGPRPRGRGIQVWDIMDWTVFMLQWGHDLAVVESSSCTARRRAGASASMGPRPRGRGIRGAVGAVTTKRPASMGPRPRGRGIAAGATARRRRPRFNGATTSRSWNPPLSSMFTPGMGMLQWGHDLAVVESRSPRGTRRGRAGASMGPRPRGRGI